MEDRVQRARQLAVELARWPLGTGVGPMEMARKNASSYLDGLLANLKVIRQRELLSPFDAYLRCINAGAGSPDHRDVLRVFFRECPALFRLENRAEAAMILAADICWASTPLLRGLESPFGFYKNLLGLGYTVMVVDEMLAQDQAAPDPDELRGLLCWRDQGGIWVEVELGTADV